MRIDCSLVAGAVRDALARLQLVGTTREIAREASLSEAVAVAALEELRAVSQVARTERGLWLLRPRPGRS